MGPHRQDRHAQLSTRLASCSDIELAALAPVDQAIGVGGGSGVAELDGLPVFVKRIPLSDREVERPQCTANLFGLPVFAQYGVGGPGFNAWRELAANQAVTDAVLAGETTAFPLLHHWRVLPGRPALADEHADLDSVVAAMAGDAAVRARLEALAGATHSLVLFCEYLPVAMDDWLGDDPVGKAELVERQLAEIVASLRRLELLHMDGHFGNMRCDGDRIHLTDFGLVTSPRFELSAAEQDFVHRNARHDAGYAAMTLVNWLVRAVCLPDRGIPERYEYVRRCADDGVAGDVPPGVAAVLGRHVQVAARMNDFYWRVFGGDVLAEYADPYVEVAG
ncbi:serine/threonine protein phosphatase [Labedaea rhizosphaerae]|uniref:Serine/threonine protein phosphatase n=1 Tax=Labedaea rhizosphaerae TaxID=598644 RepID=A0A4R6SH86_LABRH|nr:serine/threonine protein phosphatase [Labedaea rhizosphaerae]TDQ01382.1 hypothetical protein EV186_1021250 [Labedaea rhizosphaerae]